MKVLAFSDLHHSRARAEELVEMSRDADLVIGAGDFCNRRERLPEAMNLLSGIQAPMVVVPGNAESAEELSDAAHVGTIVLHGTGIHASKLQLFGVGYAVPETPFGSWSCDLTEEAAAQLLDRCGDIDILIVHSPPRGIADRTGEGVSMGSESIRAAIERIQPPLAVCGHIHDSWGQEGRIGATRVVNLGPEGKWFEVET